jgi:O-phospho-L-seryl-tRNASec:L-selenocysteinyl-tRNA synthase
LAGGSKKEIGGHVFENFGAHSNKYPVAYLTASTAIGIKKEDIDLFVKRLEKVLNSVKMDQIVDSFQDLQTKQS